jgi:hypothetical protein
LLQQLVAYLQAQLGAYAKKVMGPGETITLQSEDGEWKRILGLTNDAAGPQRYDSLEEN